MMVKNEEKNIKRCLESIKNIRRKIDSELIILDTGSTDNTVSISKEYTDKMYYEKWNDNFSDMRNKSIKNAQGEWIFILDADEEIIDDGDIIDFFNSNKYYKYNTATMIGKSIIDKKSYSTITTLRFFKNDGDFKYDGSVHNQPLFKTPVCNLKSQLLHYGYITYDKELMEKKFKRTSTILKKELETNPENVYYRFQLAVSYRMHKDNINALRECEKAFNCFLKQKLNPKDYLYLFYEMAVNYVNSNRFEQAEKVCEEGIKVEKEYIDLYFYLGSAKSMLDKYDESISVYKKYLNLIENYDKLSIKNNTGITNYTLDLTDEVYYNLAVMNYNKKNYNESLAMLNKIKSNSYIQESVNIFTDTCFALQYYKELKDYYEKNIISNFNIKNKFLVYVEKKKNLLKVADKRKFIEVFSDGDDEYFKLNKVRLSYLNRDENLSDMIKNFMNSINMNSMLDFYGDLIYYMMNIKKSLSNFMLNITENNLNIYFNYIFQIYDDSLKAASEYINAVPDDLFQDKRINKIICKWVLSSDKLKDDDYSNIFHRYIDDGIGCLTALYNDEILQNEMIYDLKNNDEAFFLYIYLAEKIKMADKEKYIAYLKKALYVCPYMNRGIGILLNEFKQESDPVNRELEEYKANIKKRIRNLIGICNFDEAEKVINEYEEIIKDDAEILMLKSDLYAKRNNHEYMM